ncbi:MAG: hypothetical protein GXP05_05820 [Alphaproteobacteria bacterium]|nr:hypothetical protein [Alphaproteobacteria bacterium]
MNTDKLSFAVLYLCRKANPIWKSRGFLHSFFGNDPGDSYPLYFLHKGYDEGEYDAALDELTPDQRARIRYLWIDDTGMDKRAYAKACRQITGFSHLLIMNSNAIIHSKNWAELYQRALLETQGRALIGATGSWEAMTSIGVTFPNPHIRTTAFLVDRMRFLEAYGDERFTKRDSYLMESGPDSLTNMYLASGDPVLVLDNKGQLFEPKDWATSKTYRSANQENLLVGDLKTFRFHYLTRRRRLDISGRCWGEEKSATGGFFLSWIPFRIWYKHLYSGFRFKFLARLLKKAKSKKPANSA